MGYIKFLVICLVACGVIGAAVLILVKMTEKGWYKTTVLISLVVLISMMYLVAEGDLQKAEKETTQEQRVEALEDRVQSIEEYLQELTRTIKEE